jgi:hypothetical protein
VVACAPMQELLLNGRLLKRHDVHLVALERRPIRAAFLQPRRRASGLSSQFAFSSWLLYLSAPHPAGFGSGTALLYTSDRHLAQIHPVCLLTKRVSRLTIQRKPTVVARTQ